MEKLTKQKETKFEGDKEREIITIILVRNSEKRRRFFFFYIKG